MSDYTEQQDNEDLDDQVEIELDDSDEAEQEDDQPTEKAKQQAKTAQGLINSTQRKIDSGEITLDEAPKWMINDLKPKEKPAEEVSLKEKIKAELLDDMEYEKLYDTLPELEETQLEKLNQVMEAEMKLGKTKSQALKYAMFETGVQKPVTQYNSFPQIRNKLKAKVKSDPIEDYYMNNLPKAYK